MTTVEELIEALEAYVSDCSNEECEFCIRARAALAKARQAPERALSFRTIGCEECGNETAWIEPSKPNNCPRCGAYDSIFIRRGISREELLAPPAPHVPITGTVGEP
jgi:predicted Zn-ribbon and HTH transcriptional regulator